MELIVNSRKWKGTAAELNSSSRILESGDQVFVRGDATRYKQADGVRTLALLPWIQSSVKKHTTVAANVTETLLAAQIASGVITSTSAAAVDLTLPTAAALIEQVAGAAGTWIDFAVDNSAGANTVTVTASASITAIAAVLTGSSTLTVASGAVGLFRIYFTSGTVAKIYRIG